MGFLDRMVSDLIYKSTGIKARGLVRKIGGKNILLAGAGAVVAAALSEQKSGQTPAAPAQHPPAPAPPLPATPVPPVAPAQSATVAPPLPPIPVLESAAPDQQLDQAHATAQTDDDPPPEVAFAAVRTLVAASLADGEMAEAEKAIIEKHLGQSNLTAEQRQQIHRDMALPPLPSELAAQVTDPELRAALYRFAVMMIAADQQVADLEKSWLSRLGEAFELSAEKRRSLEGEIFSDA